MLQRIMPGENHRHRWKLRKTLHRRRHPLARSVAEDDNGECEYENGATTLRAAALTRSFLDRHDAFVKSSIKSADIVRRLIEFAWRELALVSIKLRLQISRLQQAVLFGRPPSSPTGRALGRTFQVLRLKSEWTETTIEASQLVSLSDLQCRFSLP
jgi:hypothetical protein